jgi:hypothetical protein
MTFEKRLPSGVSIRLVIFISMGLSHASFVSQFVSQPSDSVKPIEREEVSWSGRRDSNPRPSAPKLDYPRIFRELSGAIGALSNAGERMGTRIVGLKWGCILAVEPVSSSSTCGGLSTRSHPCGVFFRTSPATRRMDDYQKRDLDTPSFWHGQTRAIL